MHAKARPRKTATATRGAAADCVADGLPVAGMCTCSKVRGLARRLTGLYDTALAPHGLTVTQYAALAVLARAAAPLAVADLARRLQMDRTTTSRLVGPLERLGLIGRADDGAAGIDLRARPLRVTAKGQRRLLAAVPAWRDAQRTVERLLGASLRDELHRVAEAAGLALAATKRRESS
jgi:DNA-binding MarR family transcriptional regulator